MRSHLSHATIIAISHAINAISDKCDKSDTYHTCDIASLIPRPHLFLRVRRIGDLNDATRAALLPLLVDDDAAVDRDCDVGDVARPVSVTTINTTDRNAAEPRGEAGNRVAFRLRLNSKKKAVTVLQEEELALVVLGCKRAVHGELRKLSMVNIGRIDCSVILEEDDEEDGGEGGSGSMTSLGLPHRLCHLRLGRHGRVRWRLSRTQSRVFPRSCLSST
jgi:hypothetical protein